MIVASSRGHISSLGSPTERPPMEKPEKGSAPMKRALAARKVGSKAPWVIPKSAASALFIGTCFGGQGALGPAVGALHCYAAGLWRGGIGQAFIQRQDNIGAVLLFHRDDALR